MKATAKDNLSILKGETPEKYSTLQWELFKLGSNLNFRTTVADTFVAIYSRDSRVIRLCGIGEFTGINGTVEVSNAKGEFAGCSTVDTETIGQVNAKTEIEAYRISWMFSSLLMGTRIFKEYFSIYKELRDYKKANTEDETWVLNGWVLHDHGDTITLTPICNASCTCELERSPELSWKEPEFIDLTATIPITDVVKAYLLELVNETYLRVNK